MLTWQPHPLGATLLLACLLAVACQPGNIVQVQTHSKVGISACQAASSCGRGGLAVACSTRSTFHNWSASGPATWHQGQVPSCRQLQKQGTHCRLQHTKYLTRLVIICPMTHGM